MALRETQKLATCCYCGSRTVLQLTAREGHELACAKCGAPLHEMKAMPKAQTTQRPKHRPAPQSTPRYDIPARPSKPTKKKKKKRSGFWDIAEDLFDELTDILD